MFNRQNLLNSLQGIGIRPQQDVFDDLLAAYTETGRYYHTDKHIAECLQRFQGLRSLARRPSEIEVALWFHDAIYDTRRSDNEERSAAWAREYLRAEGADAAVIRNVVAMILATKTHATSASDAALLVDIDLGILGASDSAFESYDRAIRLEYHWVPEDRYRAGRAQILKTFLERDRIYNTAEIRDAYEHQARRNLSRKVAELAA